MAQHSEFWHKKRGKSAANSAKAVHSSIKDGRLVEKPVRQKDRAVQFLTSLRQEIRKAV